MAQPLHVYNRTPEAVYIHIPFCTNKCYYCDFNSYVLNGQPVDAYLEALEREMAETVRLLPPKQIRTIFVGGGTPTVLTPEQMERFLTMVRAYFPFDSEQVEFTMEANPGTTDLPKLQAMLAGGVNRISFGAQTFDNGLLEKIGRIHQADDVYKSIANARQAGFTNLSIDLMFGLPQQTLSQLEDSLHRAFELELPHYSIYSLKVEENTLFHSLYEKGQLPLPTEELEWEMYRLIREQMRVRGYRQYEISNFALQGKESKHNTVYWHNEYYYGIGAGAHGYHDRLRHVNVKGVQPYIESTVDRLPRLSENPVSEEEAMEDFMMVGLRLLDGIERTRFLEQFGREFDDVFGVPLQRLLEMGLIEQTGSGYRLTEKGIPLGNEVFAEFINALETTPE